MAITSKSTLRDVLADPRAVEANMNCADELREHNYHILLKN